MPNERERTKDMQLFFDFVNTDIGDMPVSIFSSYLFNYQELLDRFSDVIHGLDANQKKLYLIGEISASDEKFETTRRGFVSLQDYVKKVLSGIMKSSIAESSVVQIEGVRLSQNLYLDAEKKTFRLKHDASKMDLDNFSLGEEKKLLNTILSSLLIKYDLIPSRFHLCERKACGNHFYKTTIASKYCSKNCSNAENVAASRRRKKN